MRSSETLHSLSDLGIRVSDLVPLVKDNVGPRSFGRR